MEYVVVPAVSLTSPAWGTRRKKQAITQAGKWEKICASGFEKCGPGRYPCNHRCCLLRVHIFFHNVFNVNLTDSTSKSADTEPKFSVSSYQRVGVNTLAVHPSSKLRQLKLATYSGGGGRS